MSTSIHLRPWNDPVIDTIGHDPRSWYAELFWLPTLGPTSLLLMRRLAMLFEEHPDGVELDVAETARLLGLGERGGRSSPLWRSLLRLVQFELAAQDGDEGALVVRRILPPINRRHVRRLPPSLQEVHEEWMAARLADAPLSDARTNAQRTAVVLTQLGGKVDDVERALVGQGFHPAVCWEAAAWARERCAAPSEILGAEIPTGWNFCAQNTAAGLASPG